MQALLLHLSSYIESLKGRALTPLYIQTEATILRVFGGFWGERDFRSLRRSDLYDYVLWLKERPSQSRAPMKPRSVHRYAFGAKRYVEWLYRHGFLLSNPADGFTLIRYDRTSTRCIPTQEEIATVLDTIGLQRERALFELMYSSGLRIAETLSLELADLKLEERVLLIRQGKGKKDRYVPFSQVARIHLVAYLQGDRRKALQGLSHDQRKYLFLGYQGKMTRSMAADRWKVALHEAHLDGKGYTLHSIRHACATHLLENGASVRYVQELLGHECLTTTQRYTRPGTDRIKAVYRTYHPRENELYEEITEDYRHQVLALRDELLTNRKITRERHSKAGRKPNSRRD
ncbi:MAG TPA: tyrosine-type recombinase/integrase [Dehalococcoidia bacterium]|nr:tyrosine-type recombinase/integrase [Dehalococcoidia bacterium]